MENLVRELLSGDVAFTSWTGSNSGSFYKLLESNATSVMRTGLLILILTALAAIPASWFISRLKGIVSDTNRIRIKRHDSPGMELMPGDTGFASLKKKRRKVYFYPDKSSSNDDHAGTVKDPRIAHHLRAGGQCLFKVISKGEDYYIIEYTLM